jgi:hypothetical protein
MRTIEPIEIVFTNGGNRKKVAYNWLLDARSDWTMEVNPFIIQDPDIKRKLENIEETTGKPIKQHLLRKYPKHGLEIYLSASGKEEEEIQESNTLDVEDLLKKGISDIKMLVDENEEWNIDIIIEAETQGKNRKTLIDYLHGIK